jgi:hypothetical protein
VEFWYGQGFISRTTYDGLRQHCDLAAVALWRTDGDSGAEGECARHRYALPTAGAARAASALLWPPVCPAAACARRLPPRAHRRCCHRRRRDAALREAAGYSLYGINAPLCALRPDGSPRERQPDWPGNSAALSGGRACLARALSPASAAACRLPAARALSLAARLSCPPRSPPQPHL